jgi:PAS domain-containing protein
VDASGAPTTTAPEELAASVVDAMPDPVIAVAADTSLLWGNRAAEERYGAPLSTLLGRSLAPLIHPDDLDTALLAMVSVLDKTVGTLVDAAVYVAKRERPA